MNRRATPAHLRLLLGTVLTLAGVFLPAVATLGQGDSGGRVVAARPAKAIVDFELTDQNGKPFRLSRLQGQPVLVFFGFTNCPVACPAAMGQLLALTRSADPSARAARVVMITTDGERDTPAVMRRYLARLSPDFIGLTGPPKEVSRIAAQFSAVFFRGRAADASGNYLVEHTTQIYLLDRAGRLRHTFFDAPVDTLARVTASVAAEEPPSHKAE